MATTFKVPMNKLILTLFLLAVTCIAAAVAWSFKSGLTWTGICLIAVAGPLSLFYWYMLYITPKRATITVAEEGVLLAAPPFASAVIPWISVKKRFRVDLAVDPAFRIKKTKKFMTFGGYKSGVVELSNGEEAVIVANRSDVFCLQTEDRFYLLGPSDLPGFMEAVEKIGP